jgi:citrate/tricarballylate utilization protein
LQDRRLRLVLSPSRLEEGSHVMTVCNACRYCEAFCPVFPAMEHRVSFAEGDLMYLANLCHNCGECLYACQYAPPHEFGIDVPRTLAQIRLESYEACCWPTFMRTAFRRQPMLTATLIVVAFVVVLAAAQAGGGSPVLGGDFYQVIPHDAMVALFGIVSIFVVVALTIGCRRFWTCAQAAGAPPPAGGGTRTASGAAGLQALADILTLRHLHGGGVDCTSALDTRLPWRRWWHHTTFYGFALCFASTSVAALYHVAGWRAPYPYISVPVLLGTAGGIGLLVGPVGLLALRRSRDVELRDVAQDGLDVSLSILLILTSVTGLLLLLLRGGPVMRPLLVVHLAVVLALFLSLPYGKFVHGVYRAAALVRFAVEDAADKRRSRNARSGKEAA